LLYDRIAERIRELLQDSHRNTTIATFAAGIGWNRSSLSNFLNRKTRTIPTHLLARIATALRAPVGYLMSGGGGQEADNSPGGTVA